MSEVICVHGIGPPEEGGAPEMLASWVDSIAAGSPNEIGAGLLARSSMVYYRDWRWMKRRGAQGDDLADLESFGPEFTQYVEDLADAWLRAAAASAHEELATPARRQLAAIESAGREGAQGIMRVGRASLQAAAKVPFFAHGGFGIVKRINSTNLWQVAAYVNDLEGSKQQVLDRFGAEVTDETRIVIAHSLGTVVAYEAIHDLDVELDLLLTTGSPLGLNTLIYPRLVPNAAFPAKVKRWVNVADPDDFVAAEPTLSDRFGDLEGTRAVEDIAVHNVGRAQWHSIKAYLSHDQVRSIIWEALDGQ